MLRRFRLFLALGVAATAVPGFAGQARETKPDTPGVARATLLAPVTPFVIDVDLRDLPQPREWQPGDPIFEVPKRSFLPPGSFVPVIEEQRDPLAEQQISFTQSTRSGGSSFTVPLVNVIGIPFNGAGVPDTNGDVGPHHIMESINGTRVQIWDKAMPTPNPLANFLMDSLGTGLCSNGAEP
jgi:hypothetical protein